jgi:endonuclease/exonuclease/phosphatase family metal-dependent hydrolase
MPRKILLWIFTGLLSETSLSFCQHPHDLFLDVPPYATGFMRIGTWNVRHLNVETNSQHFFRGSTRDEDCEILITSIAKAICDLQLDVVVLIELQPRPGEADRLFQLVQLLRQKSHNDWRSDRTCLEYDRPDDPYGNLQFGLLWNATRNIEIDPCRNRVLEDLRQPRSATGDLLCREHRAPWLVPVTIRAETKSLEFDVLALHLKSGGTTPQAAEVDAVAGFISAHQSGSFPKHLIVCGDWNIRPDESDGGRGRPRLRKLTVPTPNGRQTLMRLLTVGDIPPTFDEWEQLSICFRDSGRSPGLWRLLPYSHIGSNADAQDTLLDHVAISRTLDELFDHPLEVRLANGNRDLRPGIEIVTPLVPHSEFMHFTDHFPTVLTLKIDDVRRDLRNARVRILAVDANPRGDESQLECVVLKNETTESLELAGWRIQNSAGNEWKLDAEDSNQRNGRLTRGRTVAIYRRARPMTLSNSGDVITLLDASGRLMDTQRYGSTRTGEVHRLE